MASSFERIRDLLRGSLDRAQELSPRQQREEDRELRQVLADIPIHELQESWHDFNDAEAVHLFLNLSPSTMGDLFSELSDPDQEWLLEHLGAEHTQRLLDQMEPDDLADIIQGVRPEIRDAIWNQLSEERRKEAQYLLRFDEDDAAGLMTPRYVAIRSHQSVDQALAFIRKNADQIETIYYIYVVDHLQRLMGVVSLRDLISAPESTIIGNLMVKKVITVLEDTDQEEVAKTLEAHNFIALPVVDRYNRLLGIVTFDDIIDVIREEQTEDLYRMGAMEGSTDTYTDSSIGKLLKKRVPWLILLLVAGTITTNVLDSFSALMAQVSALILFVPVITQTGGNSATQSTTLMVRGLAMGEITIRDFWRVSLKEVVTGILMGAILGVVIFLRAWLLPPGVEIIQALAIGASLIFVVLFSNVIGAITPLIIHKLGHDPTVIAGPMMATIIDVIGLSVYFLTARTLLNL